MLNTTFEILRSGLKADPTLSPADRARWLVLLRNGLHAPNTEPPTLLAAPRILRRKETAERLGRSLRAVDMLAQQGVLRKIKLPNRQRSCGFLEAEINALIQGGGK